MRLVRIASRNVNTTVGAVRSQRRSRPRAGARGRRRRRDGGRVSRAASHRGYPPEDLVQWRGFVDAQWRSSSASPKETARSRRRCSSLGVTVARGAGVYNCAALVHARPRPAASCPKEKLPTYNVFYEGRTFARGAPGLDDELHGVPFGDLVFDFDFGTLALEVCEDIWSPDGPMRRRCYAGAELVVNLSRLALSARRRRDAARDDLRRAPATTSAPSPTRTSSAPTTASSSTAAASSPRTAGSCSRRRASRGLRGGDGRSRSHAAAAQREHHLARPTRRASPRSRPKIVHVKVTRTNRRARRGCAYPAPAHRSFFLPAPSSRPRRARRVLRGPARRAGARASATTSRRPAPSRPSASRSRADATAALPVHRAPLGGVATPAEREAARGPARVLHAVALLVGRDARRGGAAARDLDVPFAIVSIDDAFERELAGDREDAPARRDADADGAAERAGPLRAQRMWNWANSPAGCSCRRAT